MNRNYNVMFMGKVGDSSKKYGVLNRNYTSVMFARRGLLKKYGVVTTNCINIFIPNFDGGGG